MAHCFWKEKISDQLPVAALRGWSGGLFSTNNFYRSYS
jgi:hypothetical protein